MAKRALQLLCLDQENMKLKVEQWNKMYPESSHHFRPYVAKKNGEDQKETQNETIIGDSFSGNDGIDGELSITDNEQ